MKNFEKYLNKIKNIPQKMLPLFKKLPGLMLNLFKKYYFIIFGIIALMIPHYLLSDLPKEKVFAKSDVAFVSSMFSLWWAFAIALFCVCIPKKKWGKIAFAFVALVYIALAFGQYVYYLIFGDFFWIKSIFLAGEGATYIKDIINLIDAKIIIGTLVSVVFVIAALVKWKSLDAKFRVRLFVALVPAILIIATHIYMNPGFFKSSMWDAWRNPRVVYTDFKSVNSCFEINGFYQFTARDIINAVLPKDQCSDSDRQAVDEFFAQKGDAEPNQYTGMFEGKNVIAVMMESIDTWTVTQKHTPTLYKMINEGINFTNFNTPMFGTGFTFGSEFAFNTGLYTPSSAANASRFDSHSYPYAIANLFKQKGYTTNSYHFNDAGYYNRDDMHKAFGYQKHNSFKEFGLMPPEGELDSFVLGTDGIYEHMVKDKPFFDFVITYSAHLPYEGESKKLELAKDLRPDLINTNMNPKMNNALILASDTDKFFEMLLQKLDEDGILEDTVIIGFTDHFAYGLYDDELVDMLKGDNQYKVPAFIYNKGMEPMVVDKPCMTIDMAPTIANLFGLADGTQYVGNDILSPKNSGFVFLQNGDWIDSNMYYDHKNPPKDRLKKQYITDMCNKARKSIAINDIIVLGDYYKQ